MRHNDNQESGMIEVLRDRDRIIRDMDLKMSDKKTEKDKKPDSYQKSNQRKPLCL